MATKHVPNVATLNTQNPKKIFTKEFMAKKSKKTFRRYCVIKNCKIDFGLGIGVVGRDTTSYTDERNQGFDTPSFQWEMEQDAADMLKQYCTVLIEEKVKGSKWDKDPQKTAKKS